MKKLLAIALVASMGSVAMAQCSPDPVDVDAAWVYNVKFSGKTTIGVQTSTKISGGVCAPGTSTNGCIRVPGSINIEGWAATCNPSCNDITDIAAFTDTAFWATKPVKSAVTVSTFNFNDVANVMGKKATGYEAAGKFEGTLDDLQGQEFAWTFAGLGKFTTKTLTVSSISGNFAGTMSTSYYVKNGVCCPTVVFNCEDLNAEIADTDTVAFGTWSVKYNAGASKKYVKDGTTPKTPAWLE